MAATYKLVVLYCLLFVSYIGLCFTNQYNNDLKRISSEAWTDNNEGAGDYWQNIILQNSRARTSKESGGLEPTYYFVKSDGLRIEWPEVANIK